MSTKAVATYLANYLNANRYYPFFAGFIMIGYKDKPEMYSTDVVGGFGQAYDFTSIGSGSTFAMGVLDKGYSANMNKNDAIELVVDSIKASRKRDVYTGGDKIDILLITKDGIEELHK
jgi:proteasome beta subunit